MDGEAGASAFFTQKIQKKMFASRQRNAVIDSIKLLFSASCHFESFDSVGSFCSIYVAVFVFNFINKLLTYEVEKFRLEGNIKL